MITDAAERLATDIVTAAISAVNVTTTENQTDESGFNQPSTKNCSNELCLSDDDYVDYIETLAFPNPTEWVFVVLYVALLLVGLLGNALVCYAVLRNHHMRTVTNVFIVNLAVADFMVLLVCLPATLLADTTETWYVTGPLGHATCKAVIFLQTVSVSVSVLTLSAISLERWYAICHPLTFRATMRRACVTIAIVWTVAIISALPEIVVIQFYRTFKEGVSDLLTYCSASWQHQQQRAYQIYQMITFYFVPLLVMSVCYAQISIALWINAIPGHAEGRQTTGHGKSNVETQLQGRRKAAKMLIAVVIMFAVCYLPVYVLNILRYAGILHLVHDDVTPYIALIAHSLCYFNSAVNPIIYNFMSAKFRSEFRSVCACCLRRSFGKGRVHYGQDNTMYSYKYTSNTNHSEHVTSNTMVTTA